MTPDSLPTLQSKSCDVGVAITVLQHVPDSQAQIACRELTRVCERVVLIEDANPEGVRPAAHMQFRTPQDYAAMLGMRCVRVHQIDGERPGSHWLAVYGSTQ
jgi:hypothetical protein